MGKAKAPAAKVTFQAKAYLNTEWNNIDSVVKGEQLPNISQNGTYFEKEGYAQVGTVEVIITLHSTDKIVQHQIDALTQMLAKQRADAHMAERAILERISKLQALTLDGAVSEAA